MSIRKDLEVCVFFGCYIYFDGIVVIFRMKENVFLMIFVFSVFLFFEFIIVNVIFFIIKELGLKGKGGIELWDRIVG